MQNVVTVPRPAADVVMRRLLRIPDGPAAPDGAAQRAFSTPILVSATRACSPTSRCRSWPRRWAWPRGGPAIGIPVGVVAIAANVLTIRRFWAADHRWRWAYTAVALSVIVLLAILLVEDLASLIG